MLKTLLLAFVAIALQSNYSQPTLSSALKFPRLQATAVSEATASRLQYYSNCLRIQLLQQVATLRSFQDRY